MACTSVVVRNDVDAKDTAAAAVAGQGSPEDLSCGAIAVDPGSAGTLGPDAVPALMPAE